MATIPVKQLHGELYPNANPTQARLNFDRLLQLIKRRRMRYQWYINNTNNIMRKSRYVRKRLIVAEEQEEAEELEGLQ